MIGKFSRSGAEAAEQHQGKTSNSAPPAPLREILMAHQRVTKMRLRFSVRLMFVLVTLLAISLYWFVARPSLLANRFVAAVNAHDFETAASLFDGKTTWALNRGPQRNVVIDRVYTELLPREWSDMWNGERRIIFRVAYHQDDDGRHVEWTSDTDIIARPTGLHASGLDRRAMLSRRPEIPARHRAHQALLP
jgi:hypothetical protein